MRSGCRHRRWGRDDCGVAAIEFGLMVPVLLLLCLGLIDFSTLVVGKAQLANAARAGGQYAMRHTTDTLGIQTAAKTAGSLPPDSVAVTVSAPFCLCVDGGAVSCAGLCSGGVAPGTYMSVAAQSSFSTILSYPTLANPVSYTQTMQVRIQ